MSKSANSFTALGVESFLPIATANNVDSHPYSWWGGEGMFFPLGFEYIGVDFTKLQFGFLREINVFN